MILVLFAGLMMAFIWKDGFLYGSYTDWISQHIVLPDYFRQRFYQTGDFFPDFAMNLGGGQNIYYLSYYGLFSPIILISYVLPGVPMAAYIMASSIVIVLASVCLCFWWLRNNLFSYQITFIATFCFLCAGPLIFNSHRQLPFMDYFPFLLLGLICVDRYFRTHKKGLFIISVFLCIMTSYFFSVGAILALMIYAAYKAVKETQDYRFRRIFREIFPLIRGVLIAISMAGILWLPTLYVIAGGKQGGGDHISILSLIIPPVWAVLYSEYTVGLTVISLIALFVIVFRSKILGCAKHEKFLAVMLLLFLASPIFLYLMNGTLYVRGKALIPFLPLYVLAIAIFLTRFTKYMMDREKAAPYKTKAIVLMLFALIICDAGLNCLRVNIGDNLASDQEYSNIYNPDKTALIRKTLKNDPSFYRMSDLLYSNVTSNQVYDPRYYQTSIYSSTGNKDYNRFYYDVLHNPIAARNRIACISSNNIFSQTYMNSKYIVAQGRVPAGYHLADQIGDYGLYENDNTLPLAFSTEHTMSQAEFEGIPFPYNMGVLFKNIIVDKKTGSAAVNADTSGFAIQKIDLRSKHLTTQNRKNVVIKKAKGHFYIKAKDNALMEHASLEIPLDISLKKEILIISFKVTNKENPSDLDTFITINGMRNKLSMKSAEYPNDNTDFIYVLSSARNTKRLKVSFSAGEFEVYDFKAYTLPVASVPTAVNKMDPFVVDPAKTGEDQIIGDIKVTSDGYFATTIPFDKGFDIKVDGISQKYEKVNTAFVGFPIEKGSHHIVIRYHAPLKKAGMALSLAGFLMLGISCVAEQKRKMLTEKTDNDKEIA